ncbi:hypothetical protein HanRHA438_Chr14g0632661 [Helianthus annuus]|nr:hypothetical protein HanRHA438_Chr14g0632661 [Helianthus annuus]
MYINTHSDSLHLYLSLSQEKPHHHLPSPALPLPPPPATTIQPTPCAASPPSALVPIMHIVIRVIVILSRSTLAVAISLRVYLKL